MSGIDILSIIIDIESRKDDSIFESANKLAKLANHAQQLDLANKKTELNEDNDVVSSNPKDAKTKETSKKHGGITLKMKANKIIDELMNKRGYYVDFVPFVFQNENYTELENFLDKDYKKQYAKKIEFIAFSLMYYYDCHVYLDDELEDNPFLEYRQKDIRNIGLDKLDILIKKMIIENYAGLNIIIDNHDATYSLMRIEDGYQTLFFNMSGECLDNVKQLVNHQGLFLKQII